MKPQPITITISTMLTLVMTMIVLTNADSWVPRMSSIDNSARMMMAGMLTRPDTPAAECSSGEWLHWYGTLVPKNSSTLLKYSLQAIATVAAPTAYSSTRSHPMIQATNSPIVA